MKKPFCLVTTYYGLNSDKPNLVDVSRKLNYDGKLNNFFINFDNTFDPWNTDHLNVGVSWRKDLIYAKIFLLNRFIKLNIEKEYEYICHIDFSDTKFVRSFTQMMEEFESDKTDFVISTEKKCWPYLDHMKTITHNTSLEDTEFKYINSGALISKVSTLIKYLEELSNICISENIDFWDDQGVWQYYNITQQKLNSDNNCKYFFSTALLDNTYYTLDQNGLRTKFNTNPYLVHDNSSFSLNLINNNIIKGL